MEDNRMVDLLPEMLIRLDRQERATEKLVGITEKALQVQEGVATSLLKQGETLEKRSHILLAISRKLTDNGTHEPRIQRLEAEVFKFPSAGTSSRKPKK